MSNRRKSRLQGYGAQFVPRILSDQCSKPELAFGIGFMFPNDAVSIWTSFSDAEFANQ
jgi:hypothetical protein